MLGGYGGQAHPCGVYSVSKVAEMVYWKDEIQYTFQQHCRSCQIIEVWGLKQRLGLLL